MRYPKLQYDYLNKLVIVGAEQDYPPTISQYLICLHNILPLFVKKYCKIYINDLSYD